MEVSFIVAFFSGLVSFFAPCVIPLLPAYVSFITGISVKELMEQKSTLIIRRQVVMASIFFTTGFSLLFVILGTTAAGIGIQVRQHIDLIQIISGILIFIFGLNMLNVIILPKIEVKQVKLPYWVQHYTYLKAFILGVIFATIWTPCVGAVLGAILTLAALSSTAVKGAVLLFIFSLGISLPFIFIALTLSRSTELLKKIKPVLPLITKLAGVILLLLGLLLINNTLEWGSKFLTYNYLNGWLLQQGYKLGFEIQ